MSGAASAGGGLRGAAATGGGAGGAFDDAKSEATAGWLEGRMETFLQSVAPELEGVSLDRSCTSNGELCTFQGPWPDEFGRRWVEALAYGELRTGDLEGMSFSEFRQVEGVNGPEFVITAEAPP